MALFAHSLNGPLLLAQRATIVLLHPKRHAAVVKRMIALSPDHHAVLSAVKVLLAFRLATETRICKFKSNQTIKRVFTWRLPLNTYRYILA